MPPKSNLELLEGGGRHAGQADRLSIAIELLRARISEEFEISERLDSKGRQIFTLAVGFFAVAQAVAFGGFGIGQIVGSERFTIVPLAFLAVLALLSTGHRLANAEEPQSERDLKPQKIEQWAQEHDDETFARKVVVHLREIADRRHASNGRRVDGYRKIATSARWALILTTAEVLVAISFRA